jgi:type IV secretion system protein VirB6
MACTPIITGDRFLGRVLEHIDCQAQSLGTFGYQALAEPGSLASTVVSGLLTLFIAIFAIRLLLGYPTSGRDVVTMVLKVGIVLTLAFSWPAFRTVVYDVAIRGPGEIAAVLAPAGTSAAAQDLPARLQSADAAMLRLTEAGTGRNIGQLIDSEAPGGTFEASALEDENSFGMARLFYLAGIIGSLALLRILAGLLLALAPLAAGLLLLPETRGLFAGWLKGIVLVTLGSLGATVVIAVELAVLEPWLADALRVRSLGYATPAAPTELLALTLAFGVVQLGMIWLLAKVAFNRGWLSIPALPEWVQQAVQSERIATASRSEQEPLALRDRSLQIAGSVERIMRAERDGELLRTEVRALQGSGAGGSEQADGQMRPRLGHSARRTSSRQTLAARQRDTR